MRIMAIDYGESRIGIAITDPMGIISQPLLTLKKMPEKILLKRLKYITKEKKVGFIILGNPLSHKGSATRMSRKIKRFRDKLKNHLMLDVRLWDERFTSKYALARARQYGIKIKKDQVDQVAACIILEEYLKSRKTCSA